MTLQQLIPDLICGGILLLFLVVGAVRGMFRTLSGLMSWLVSLWGGKLIADAGAPMMADWLTPKLLPKVAEQLAETMQTGLADTSASDPNDLKGMLGLIPGVKELLEGATDSLAEALAPAVARQAALVLGWLVLFAAGFLILKLLCRLLTALLDLLDQVPGLHLLNHIIGAGLGLLKGILLVAAAVLLLKLVGVLPQNLLEETVLLRQIDQFILSS